MKLKHIEQRSLWYKKIFYYLKSGQSLSESVRTAATDADMMQIYEELAYGLRFSEVCSLEDFEDVFTQTEVSLLKVAEQTGNTQSVCNILSQMLKEQYEQYQKLVAAMIYPVLVLCMACGLLLMILTVVVPKIAPLFSSMKNIPIATHILITISNHVVHMWYVDVLFLFFICIGYIYLRKNTRFFAYIQKHIQQVCVYVPYVKDVYLLWFIERWMQVVYLSLVSKVPITQSLVFAYQSVSHTYIRSQFEKVSELVEQGNTCSEAMGYMDSMIKDRIQDWISVISSGEKTGTLEDVFGVSHEHVVLNLKESFDRFQKIIEPLLIILVGVMVLCICLAIILPMYQLTQSVQ
jgi:type II secretory pathway component PulF